jgi:hypothetical protein
LYNNEKLDFLRNIINIVKKLKFNSMKFQKFSNKIENNWTYNVTETNENVSTDWK